MLTTYIIGSLALIVKPGPDLTCTIATALSDGKARAATVAAFLDEIGIHKPALRGST